MANPVRPRSIPWHLILIFLLLSLGILSTGYFYYNYEQAYFKKQKLDEIAAIADLKIKQIVNWQAGTVRRCHLDYARLLFCCANNRLVKRQSQTRA